MDNHGFKIVYAPMPIFQNNKVVAYITSRCYLIEETISYKYDKVDYLYKVVYFYNQRKEKINPRFENDVCINSHKVPFVFEDVRKCQNYVRNLNERFIYQMINNCKNINQVNNICNHKQLYLKKYYDLEQELLKEKASIIDFKSKKRALQKVNTML